MRYETFTTANTPTDVKEETASDAYASLAKAAAMAADASGAFLAARKGWQEALAALAEAQERIKRATEQAGI